MNHRNRKKDKTDQLNEHDVRKLYMWIYGYRGNPAELEKYEDKVAEIPLPLFMKKRKLFSTTRVTNGVCNDCGKERCSVCNGCPTSFEDIDNHHCMRCICYAEEEQEPLNNIGVPLDKLVRRRQGSGFKKEKNN